MSRCPLAHATPYRPRRRVVTASRRALLGIAAATFAGAATRAAEAQNAILVQGIADAEAWKTDSGSILLTRNGGQPSFLGRMHLWGAAGVGRHVVVYAAGTMETGNARTESGTEWNTELAGVRYTQSSAFVIDAGKMAPVVGTFAARRYSTRNPLIGMPDGYPLQYPLGVQASGARGPFDYRAAVVSLPVQHEGYTPVPTPTPRPALGAGFTPTVGARFGVSATWGPYLNRDLAPTLLAGRSWRAYNEGIYAADAQLSRGYLELHAELARSSYEVPEGATGIRTVRGLTYYTEAKYTLTPRLFAAGRFERNDYPYIQPVSDAAWIANPTNMYDGEAGVGYRVTSRTLLKASVRSDRWDVPPEMRAFLGNGTALALQLSQSFDVVR
jgi:hypothetical protein